MKNKPIFYIVISLIVLALLVTVLWFIFKPKPTAEQPNLPTETNNSSRVERTLRFSGMTWHYTVNSALEKKYKMSVEASTTVDVVYIGGKGCNAMSAKVYQKNNAVHYDDEIIREIGGKNYAMDSPMQTMMACEGELANADPEALAEIKAIFQSIEQQ